MQTAMTAAAPAPLTRRAGVTLAGAYDGSGYEQPRFLVVRGDGQAIQVTRVLYEVLAALDGTCDAVAASAAVSSKIGRELTADGLRLLAEQKLRPLGLLDDPPGVASPAQAAPVADPLLRVRLHATLLPARWVPRLGRIFAPLFHPVPVVGVVALLPALDVYLLFHASLSAAMRRVIIEPADLLALLGVMVVAALFHETGHAAGCVRGGGRPGAIGVGLYVIFPAFYTDVTDAYRLSRRGRLRTDLGGVYFSAIAAVCAGVVHVSTGAPVALVVCLLAQTELAQQLLPFVRLDGYFVLGDLIGIPDPFGRVKPILEGMLPGRHIDPQISQLRRGVRITVTVWVLLVVPLLAPGLALLVWQLPTIVTATWASILHQWAAAQAGWAAGNPFAVILAAVAAAIAAIPAVGLAFLGYTLLHRAARWAVNRGRKQRDTTHQPHPTGDDPP